MLVKKIWYVGGWPTKNKTKLNNKQKKEKRKCHKNSKVYVKQ